MAPPPRYPDPPQQLARLAADARAAGTPFDQFWQHAVQPEGPALLPSAKNAPPGIVLWPSDTVSRRAWRAAMLDERVREGWRRAYERQPATPADAALRLLWDALTAPGSGPVLLAA